MDAQELKELALEMTDCRSQSEQSIQTLVDTLKGNPLCVICGARNSGKTAVLATTVKLLDGDLYFLDEGGDSPNAADPAERMNRILAMRDTARARGKTAITCFSFPLNVRPDDNFLPRSRRPSTRRSASRTWGPGWVRRSPARAR